MVSIPIRDTKDGARFLVRVAPRSRHANVVLLGDGQEVALKIAVQAPAVDGRANAALIGILADLLDTSRSSIEIASGERGRIKTILVRGHTAAQISATLGRLLPDEQQNW